MAKKLKNDKSGKAKASKKLQEDVEKELKKKDPSDKVAKAQINENLCS